MTDEAQMERPPWAEYERLALSVFEDDRLLAIVKSSEIFEATLKSALTAKNLPVARSAWENIKALHESRQIPREMFYDLGTANRVRNVVIHRGDEKFRSA